MSVSVLVAETDINTWDYVKIIHFFELLLASTYQYQCRVSGVCDSQVVDLMSCHECGFVQGFKKRSRRASVQVFAILVGTGFVTLIAVVAM